MTIENYCILATNCYCKSHFCTYRGRWKRGTGHRGTWQRGTI